MEQAIQDEKNVYYVDIRDRESFLSLHLKNSGHIPLSKLDERQFELPPPGVEGFPTNICVIYEGNDQITQAQEILESKNYTVVQSIEGKDLAHMDNVESGKTNYHLWEPNPCLYKLWSVILDHLKDKKERTCLDLAAGNGRDAVFVAKEGGFDVLAIDYQERQWSKIEKLFNRTKEEMIDCDLAKMGTVRVSNMNLESDDPCDKILEMLGNKPCDLVIVSRYLHRPLNPRIPKLIAEGGFLLFHTFLEGAEKVGRKTPNKAKFLLKEKELRETYEDEFDVIEDSVIHLSDGRPTSCFLAKKKPKN